MIGIVDWASQRARMIIAMITLSLAAGVYSYTGLPKEGEPDIEIPALFISVPFPGISAADSCGFFEVENSVPFVRLLGSRCARS